MWAMFLKVAEEIRSGDRPLHAEAIASKREEIYNWVDQRIEDMFAHLEKKKNKDALENTGEGREEKKNESDDPTDYEGDTFY